MGRIGDRKRVMEQPGGSGSASSRSLPRIAELAVADTPELREKLHNLAPRVEAGGDARRKPCHANRQMSSTR